MVKENWYVKMVEYIEEDSDMAINTVKEWWNTKMGQSFKEILIWAIKMEKENGFKRTKYQKKNGRMDSLY